MYDGSQVSDDWGFLTYSQFPLSSTIIVRSKSGIQIKDISGILGPNDFTSANDDYLLGVRVGNTVTSIADQTFNNKTRLSAIVVPDSVQSIGLSAFKGCTNLTGIILPSTCNQIGISAFAGCSALKTMTFPVGVLNNYDGKNVFGRMFGPGDSVVQQYSAAGGMLSCDMPSTLTSITLLSSSIDEDNTLIPDFAFNRCKYLESITFGHGKNDAYIIGAQCFNGCNALLSIIGCNDLSNISSLDYGISNHIPSNCIIFKRPDDAYSGKWYNHNVSDFEYNSTFDDGIDHKDYGFDLKRVERQSDMSSYTQFLTLSSTSANGYCEDGYFNMPKDWLFMSAVAAYNIVDAKNKHDMISTINEYYENSWDATSVLV